MIYIYRRAASEGADLLAEDICVLGTRARRTRGGLLDRVRAGDHVVCWGNALPMAVPAGVNVLNNVAVVSKLTEAQELAASGVRTVAVSRTRPIVAPIVRAPSVEETLPVDLHINRLSVADAEALARRFMDFVRHQRELRAAHANMPVQPVEEWLPRRNNHVGGSDLLTPPRDPDYYSKKENIVEEYRLHMFKDKSIRAGLKVARPNRPNGQPTHPWIRSFDAGWIIQYEGFRSNKEQREIAAAAIKALNLDFGAVDLGRRADGTYIVLEVNRAPGVEGGTAESYARRIIKWATEGA